MEISLSFLLLPDSSQAQLDILNQDFRYETNLRQQNILC